MAKKIFGTDGIRALVGSEKMHPQFIMHLGWALGKTLKSDGKAKALIGKDTRISGYMFESALESGLCAAGVDVYLIGPLPTPSIAYLTKTLRAQAGIVISASHNPYHDNGIKFFSELGHKISADVEAEIEHWMNQPMELVDTANLGKVARIDDAISRYVEFCKSTINHRSLEGLHIVIDSANGAAYKVAPMVLTELGAKVTVLGDAPNGLNINSGLGSTHPETLTQKVREISADIGIALDGDADRCIMCDSNGRIIDGDDIVYLIAKDRLDHNKLKGPVVGTLMTNLGIELALKDLGIGFERAAVGDKYVLEKLLQHGGTIGGESSGHILCLDRTTTGDGMVGALQVIRAILKKGISLQEALDGIERMPSQLINVPVQGDAKELVQSNHIQQAVKETEAALGDNGRVLLRASGTEPLIRVMVEGSNKNQINELANALADTVRNAA